MEQPDSPTEKRNPASLEIDTRQASEIVRLMHDEDLCTLNAVGTAQASISEAADNAAHTIRSGGKVLYAGAGTSGRLGVLDASEIMPTFGSTAFRAIIAGGPRAVTQAIEGAEDNAEAGEEAAASLTPKDMAIGITASGGTPFVLGFLKKAEELGARTWLLTCSDTEPRIKTDGLISLHTGPEIIAGSTRLKAGTATKMALNMISTTAMILLGGTYDGLMVDVIPSNKKLIDRAERIIMEITGMPRKDASAALKDSGMIPKKAALMLMRGINNEQASEALHRSGGSLRRALQSTLTQNKENTSE